MEQKPVLSICLPTYNNHDGLEQVLEHVLDGFDDRIEIVVGNDASEDRTKEVVQGFDDERIEYFCNTTNKGYALNLLKTMEAASGGYVLFLSDEDKLDIENMTWILDKLESEPALSAVLGGNGTPRWNKFCSEDRWLEAGKESMITYANELGTFGHSWSRNYGGAFILKKDAIDLERGKDFSESYYMWNVLLLQAMSHGKTFCTQRQLNNKHYFKHISGEEHRIFGDVNKFSEGVNLAEHRFRIQFAVEDIDDNKIQYQFLNIEQRWAAQVTGWSLLSPAIEYDEIRAEFLSIGRNFNIADIYTSGEFWYYTVRYAIAYLIPFYTTGMSNRISPSQKAHEVWWKCVIERFVPQQITEEIEEPYFLLTGNVFSASFWWHEGVERVLPEKYSERLKDQIKRFINPV
jgi:glycosyltransferase involved in cell wall biosynthesis